MAEHARPISAPEGRRRPLTPLDALGEVTDLRGFATRVTSQVERRARERLGQARVEGGGAEQTTLAPVVSLASRARTAWRLLAIARRNKTPIGLSVAVVAVLVLVALRWRRRHQA